MPLVRVDDLSTLSDFAVVSDDALARRQGRFVAEGREVVRRLVVDGRYRVQSLLLNEPALVAMETVISALPQDVPVYVSATRGFRALTGFNLHRGCVALADRPPETPIATVLGDTRDLVVLEGVTNADNVGGVFRNVAAFGTRGVLLSPTCCDPFYRKAIRTSMAATLRVPFAWVASWPSGLADLKRSGFTIAALTPRQDAETLDVVCERPRARRLALVVGTEGAGLTSDVERIADVRVRIPITPAVDSLNLAVATGIVLSRLVGSAP